MIALIVFGLLLLFACVVGYFSARTWYVTHVLIVIAVSIASGAFLFLAAATLQTHTTWRGTYEQRRRDLESETQKFDRLSGADSLAAEDEVNLPRLQARFEHSILDRGRVWRNVRAEMLPPSQVTVDLRGFNDPACESLGSQQDEDGFVEPPDPEAQPAATPHGIEVGMVVYVFEEANLAEIAQASQARIDTLLPESSLPAADTTGVCRLPAAYLGEFKVVNKGDTTVTLEPTIPPDSFQVGRIQQAAGRTWVMYELMPIDSRTVFEGMTEQQIQSLGLPEEFVRDNQQASDADPRQQVWMQVEFLQEKSFDVDIEQDAASDPELANRSFDASGLAVSPALRQGEATRFFPEQKALFDLATAEKLIEEGVCKADESPLIYRRPLRDYTYLYRQADLSLRKLKDQAAAIQRDTKAVLEAVEETKSQVTAREQEARGLEQDLGHVKREVQVLGNLLVQLNQQRRQQRTQLSLLYRANNQLVKQLD